MRQVVLDTETTGLDVRRGHRVVEIGCVEMLERRVTGRHFQAYINPQRPMEERASEITGLTDDFLRDQPLFEDIADAFLAFIDGAELIIHNADFDVGFLDAELARAGHGDRPLRSRCNVIDSLALARERFPGQRISLDALCKRLQVDNSHRTVHGARLDAELLAEVYLNLTAGQGDLSFDLPTTTMASAGDVTLATVAFTLPVRRASAEDLAAHQATLARMAARGACLWPLPGPTPDPEPA
ncbi:MAG: DNA polymerase III subunit epsilon [Lysobacteraceae bacterium]